jgi:hypothetical protein
MTAEALVDVQNLSVLFPLYHSSNAWWCAP